LPSFRPTTFHRCREQNKPFGLGDDEGGRGSGSNVSAALRKLVESAQEKEVEEREKRRIAEEKTRLLKLEKIKKPSLKEVSA
jgi:hypothetical protein